MKLKFKASAKDYLIFAIFAIVLLYFVAIAVLNLSSFATNGRFHGFDPLPAFSSQYLIPTIVGYVFALIFIITSVSSYFFDRDKGFGFTTGVKEEKGYARWADEKEFKKQKDIYRVLPSQETCEHAGIPLINNGKEIWVDGGEYHNLILGSTGAGKTQTMVQPMVRILAKKGESMIITDPKGEIYENNAEMLKAKGYNIVLLNFRDPQRGSAWNPLGLPYQLYKSGNKDKANELLDDLAMNILYDDKAQNQDPFWEKTSADYFTGLALALFDDAKEDEINLNTINLMTTVGEEKLGNTTYIKEYFGYKDKASPAYINVSSTIMAPSDTKSSILSVFKQKIKLFSSRENLSEMLSHSDFDLKDIGRKKTAVFLVIQDEKKTYHSLVTIFIKQCYETLIDVAQESGGKLPFKTNFILDEFANMPPLKDVTTMVTAARSRNIRFTFIIQNFAQLYQVYGKENGETIKGNCGNIVYLISSELASLEEISKLCGEVKSKEKDKTASTPLVTVSDLQRLPENTIIVLRIRSMPFKTKVVPDWKIQKEGGWGKSYPKATYPLREKQPIELFDLKAYVDEKREAKLNDMMSSFNRPPVPPIVPREPSSIGGSKPEINQTGNFVPKNSNPVEDFDIDALVKRIDAKIAELEEQEKQEQLAKEQTNNKETVLETSSDINNNIENDVNLTSNSSLPKSIEEPKIELKEEENHVINGVTDDQFFDDFFNDDDE